jgi:hypothetical protein
MGAELGLCGVFAFVDQAAQDGLACDPFVVAVGDGVVWSERAELAIPVGSLTVVVSGVGRQDGSQVSFAEDQYTVGEFGSGGECESFGEAVRSGTARRTLHNVDIHVCQYGVERCRELTGSVADEKPEFGGSVTKIHQEMTGLLSGPRAVRVRGQAKDVHVAAADFQGEQHGDPSECHRSSSQGRSPRPAWLWPACVGTAAMLCRCVGMVLAVSVAE